MVLVLVGCSLIAIRDDDMRLSFMFFFVMFLCVVLFLLFHFFFSLLLICHLGFKIVQDYIRT